MTCPSCGHQNLSDFPFCEQCLELLPVRPGTRGLGGFDLLSVDEGGPGREARWPPFPWNPPDPLEAKRSGPLVGRDKALKGLSRAWDRVVSTWTSRLHLLVGEYGLGKSRVATALVREAKKREPDTRVVRVRCPTTGGPFRLWDALLREVFEIPHDADAVEAGARFREGVRPLFPDEEERVSADIAYLTGWDVRGVPQPGAGFDEEALISRGSGAAARLVAALSIREPLLIVVDHAHRASMRSLALAGAMEATLKARPVMLLLTGTPEITDIISGWERFPVTRLAPLKRRVAARMLGLFLRGLEGVPKELEARILDRAHGNPYALKSMVRYLRSSGAIVNRDGRWELDERIARDLELPDDLAGVVLAQLGVMKPVDRTILARAAVVGEEFWLGALVALRRLDTELPDEPGEIARDDAPRTIRASLDRLEERRFIEHRVGRLKGEETWGFRSSVHHAVARGILPATIQSNLHRTIWRWLEVHVGDDVDDLAEELAHHAEGAGHPGPASRYLLAAGKRQRQEHHHAECLRLLQEADALVEEQDVKTRISVDLALAEALHQAGDPEGALERNQAALNQAWQIRHRSKGATALLRIGRIERDRGAYERAWGHMHAALHLYEAVGDRPGVAHACRDLGSLFWLRGEFGKALRFFRQGEELFRKLRIRRGIADSVHMIGGVYLHQGDLDLAEEYLEDGLDLRRRLGDPLGVARTLTSLGALRLGQHRPIDAIEAWDESLAIATAHGDVAQMAMIANNLGESLTPLARYEQARRHLQNASRWAVDADAPRIRVDALRNLARLHASKAEWGEARQRLEEARKGARELGLPHLEAMVERTAGEVEAERARTGEGDREESLRRAAEALGRSATDLESAGYDLDAAEGLEVLAEVQEALGVGEAAAASRERASTLRSRHQPHEEAEGGDGAS